MFCGGGEVSCDERWLVMSMSAVFELISYNIFLERMRKGIEREREREIVRKTHILIQIYRGAYVQFIEDNDVATMYD
jgi:hypothetical protein